MTHKFNIGDIVTAKIALAAADLGMVPEPSMITEQLTQTCSGGTQLHYTVVANGQEPARAGELELILWGDSQVQGAIKKGMRIAAEQEAAERFSRAPQYMRILENLNASMAKLEKPRDDETKFREDAEA